MGNKYNVIEDGTIICACGGKVTLISTVEGRTIAGKKPLYLKDLLNADVNCPREKDKCTKVVAISTAGTQTNVSASGKTYLLRTDGFVTDKGRAVILKDPGQTTSQINNIPSLENQDVQSEEKIETEENIYKEKIIQEKYKLYFLRKSQDIYKPLRPSRVFLKAEETYDKTNFDNIYSHNLSYIYIVKQSEFLEYKVFNNGGLNSEVLKDIYFQNTKTNVITKYIPLYEEKEIKVYYSNIKLNLLSDIEKLPKAIVNPKNLTEQNGFTVKNIASLNSNEITVEKIKAQSPKNGEEKSNNLVIYIEDIIGEIEDLYNQYYTNYKLAYSHNEKIFDKIKTDNSYAYTISNIVDYFYVSSYENEEYRKNLFTLRDCYKKFVKIMFGNTKLYNYILEQKDIENIVKKDTNKKAFSFYLMLENYRKNFFSYESIFYGENSSINKIFYSEHFIITNQIKKFYDTSASKKSLMSFTGSDDYTLVKQDATKVLAHLVFCIFFLDDFEEELKSLDIYGEIIKIRNEFLITYRKITPLPNIGASKRNDVRNIIEEQEFYNQTVYKQTQVKRDNQSFIQKIFSNNKEKNNNFLNDYKQLDNKLIDKSFDFNYKVEFKSNLLYVDENIKYYKEDITFPKDILKKIKEKLESSELKILLEKYKSFKVDEFEYVIFSMNIIYSLCSTKIYLDEELEVNGIFINENIKHLLDFTDNLISRKIKLSDIQKELLIKEYKISEYFDEYLIQQLLNELLFKNSKKESSKKKTKDFLDKYQNLAKKSIKKEKKEKIEPLDLEQDIKSIERKIYEGLKFISGVTSNIDSILEEYKNNETYQTRNLTKSRALQLGLTFKTYSSFMAIASIAEYIYYNENKDIKSTIGFVSDISTISGTIVGIIQKEKFENLAQAFSDKMRKSMGKEITKINLSNSEILSAAGKGFAKVSAYAVIIMSILDSVKYQKNEDYDALAATVGIITISVIALFVTSGTPLVVFVSISSIVYAIVMLKLVDSAFEAYLKKSLFYKGNIFLDKNKRNVTVHTQGYPSKYLLETTNKNKELKAIEDKGFRTAKEIFNFIGRNYKSNEIYFDTALKNELVFLNSALYGYKLEKEDFKTYKRMKTFEGVEISFNSYSGIKIPKLIAEDDDFKLYFAPYNDTYTRFKGDLISKSDYYIFELFPEDKDYYNLSILVFNLKNANHKSYVIVKSSIIDLKYEIELIATDKISANSYVDIHNLEQVSFEVEDEKLIKGKEK
jgi:nitrogen regulatory protein PII-like uncharacterized protein